MSSKKVILEKTEYDDMENELNDLRTIVAERRVVTIVDENLNWRLTWQISSGTRIKYIVWSDQDAMKNLADQVDRLQKELEKAERDLHSVQRECGRKADEITRLNKRNWYQRLLNTKTN